MLAQRFGIGLIGHSRRRWSVAQSAELKIFGSRVTKMMMADVGPQFERSTGLSLSW